MEKGLLKFRLSNEEATFGIFRVMKHIGELQLVSTITFRSKSALKMKIKEKLGVEALAVVIINIESDFIEGYDKLMAALDRCEHGQSLRSWTWI